MYHQRKREHNAMYILKKYEHGKEFIAKTADKSVKEKFENLGFIATEEIQKKNQKTKKDEKEPK